MPWIPASALQQRLNAFMDKHVYPNEAVFDAELEANRKQGNPWVPTKIIDQLKEKAKAAGLWNLFLPESKHGAGLTNLEYAPLCEIMGRSPIAPEVFNCSRPTPATWKCWCATARRSTSSVAAAAARRQDPLRLRHDRAGVASSTPPTSRPHRARGRRLRHQRPQVVDLRRARSALQDPHLHGQDRPGQRQPPPAAVDDPGADGHPGVTMVRPLTVFGYDHAPHGHGEVDFKDVRVPVSNILLGEGRGFEIAQGRLGPGRIHHCMRLIGLAERALELMCKRALKRVAFHRRWPTRA
jgi:acyl-CoA dehydrogenase